MATSRWPPVLLAAILPGRHPSWPPSLLATMSVVLPAMKQPTPVASTGTMMPRFVYPMRNRQNLPHTDHTPITDDLWAARTLTPFEITYIFIHAFIAPYLNRLNRTIDT